MPKRRKVVATSAAPAPDKTHSRPTQSLRPGSPRETEAARTVRPRPLHVNEKVGFTLISAGPRLQRGSATFKGAQGAAQPYTSPKAIEHSKQGSVNSARDEQAAQPNPIQYMHLSLLCGIMWASSSERIGMLTAPADRAL